MNIFERASRKNLMFETARGLVVTNALWDMPLTGEFSLDVTAKRINRKLKSADEESFVETVVDPDKADNELRLEIVKHVIASKLADQDRAKKAAATKARRQRLLAALDKSEDAAIDNLSPEEIRAELAELEAAE